VIDQSLKERSNSTMTTYGSLSVDADQLYKDNKEFETKSAASGPPPSQPKRKYSGDRGFFTEHRVTVTTIIVLVFLFLSWVGTCVAFGGALHTARIQLPNGHEVLTSVDVVFRWNSIKWGDQVSSYKTELPYGSVCKEGGDGLLAMAFFAFIGLLMSLVMGFCRVCKRMDIVPIQFQRLHAYFNFQLLLSVLITIFFFLMVVIWGATCWSETANLIQRQDITVVSVALTATGFGYLIFCVVIMTVTSVIWAVLRNFEVEDVETASLLSSSSSSMGSSASSSSSSTITIDKGILDSQGPEHASSPPSAAQHQEQL